MKGENRMPAQSKVAAVTETKPRRVTIDLTPAAVEELDRIKSLTGATTADIFRYAFTLMRIYVDERQRGREFRIIDPSNDRTQIRLELPIEIGRKA